MDPPLADAYGVRGLARPELRFGRDGEQDPAWLVEEVPARHAATVAGCLDRAVCLKKQVACVDASLDACPFWVAHGWTASRGDPEGSAHGPHQRQRRGVYDSADGTFGITGTVTLDAQGTPSTVWVFQTDSTLITAPDSNVNLIDGADACNVFWQVGSSATLDTRTSFAGNILALTSVTLNTSATIRGRALARNGAVTMDTKA